MHFIYIWSLHALTQFIQPADINECELELHICHSNANCTDSIGSFKCTCGKGFEGDGYTCTGKQLIDELTCSDERVHGSIIYYNVLTVAAVAMEALSHFVFLYRY